jgi:hypothetical protein
VSALEAGGVVLAVGDPEFAGSSVAIRQERCWKVDRRLVYAERGIRPARRAPKSQVPRLNIAALLGMLTATTLRHFLLLPEVRVMCFLCNPPRDLVYAEAAEAFALAGLGPLVPGYSVAAARSHIRSIADIADPRQFFAFLKTLRRSLTQQYGDCLVTEHGRLPACLGSGGATEPHCYHAHVLIFPGAPSVEALAVQHFEEVLLFDTMEEAILAARRNAFEYFLLSSAPDRFLLMLRPRFAVRQLGRVLVATALDTPDTFDWQQFPRRDDAQQFAATLRSALSGVFDA